MNDSAKSLLDEFPLFFEWEITNECNSKCVHCYNNSGRKLSDELNNSELDKVVEELCKRKPIKVDFIGGEPLLHPGLFKIARKLKKHGISLGVITNGSLLSDSKIKEMKELFSMIQISLDGNKTSNSKIRGENFQNKIEKEGLN